jgi:hypothetical protein
MGHHETLSGIEDLLAQQHHRHVTTVLNLPPAGGGRRGEAKAGEKTMGHTIRAVPPSQPPPGEASETVWSPTLLAFLIDDNVYGRAMQCMYNVWP